MARNGKKTESLTRESSLLATDVDGAISWLAARQDGRVARRQLIAMGIAEHAIDTRVRLGRLMPRDHGVYAVGFVSGSPRARLREALLAVGDDALASHLAAAGDWGFWPRPSVIDITCGRKLPPRPGIRLHCRFIELSEVCFRDGIAMTSPAQTIFDLGTMLGANAHAKAANQAFVDQLCGIEDLREIGSLNKGRRGSRAFRRLLGVLDPDGREVRSPLEVRLNAFLRYRGFPSWESNVALRIGADTIRPDVIWREQRVIVEADGRDPHLAPLTFDSDRRRDRRLRVHGWEPVRVTSRHLDEGPDELDSDLRILLGIRSA